MLLKLIPNKIKVWLLERLYKDIAAEGRDGVILNLLILMTMKLDLLKINRWFWHYKSSQLDWLNMVGEKVKVVEALLLLNKIYFIHF
jgi:hypothetical protein